MALRWCAAGMVEAGKQFRRVNGHLHLAQLPTALDADRRNRHSAVQDGGSSQPDAHRAATEALRNSGQPRSLSLEGRGRRDLRS
jgi:hypothetical protein